VDDGTGTGAFGCRRSARDYSERGVKAPRALVRRRMGVAGGRFEAGAGGPEMEVDAVEFVRALSGRGTREEILGTRVVF
jgi:hypothetical protein